MLVIQVSCVWQTAAAANPGVNFLNAALVFTTGLVPETLRLQVLGPVERSLGRVRNGDKFAARTIDLDIVTLGGKAHDPDLWSLAHLAAPVAELLPDLRSPRLPSG